jgi:DNA-directed RNA polymerase specialized sigma24 family protein
MGESRVTSVIEAKWKASESSFVRFLAWIDDGRESDGQEYLALRGRLVAYFDRKGCDVPDELADQTLERVNRRLDEVGEIVVETPAKFCYITAKFVFLEYLRSARRREDTVDPADLGKLAYNSGDEGDERKEVLSVCLDRCLNELSFDDRSMIMGYYVGERRAKIDNRRSLAAKFGLSPNALAIRACRIRERLELCIRNCSQEVK